MSLVPTKFPTNLNSGGMLGSLLGKANVQQGIDGLVKTAGSSTLLGTGRQAISFGKSIIDGISNLAGIRSPYFTIGEIRDEHNNTFLGDSTAGNLYRAITSSAQQPGVIIDCLGDIDGTWAVEFTTNPVFYGTNTAVNSRVRVPTKLTAVVAISNYLSDDGLQSTVSAVAETYAGALGGAMANTLLYNGNTRAQYGLYKLINLMENGDPFTVYTPHGVYNNMLIKNIQVKTDDKTMDMLHATLTFEEIIMAQPYYNGDKNKLVKIPGRRALTDTSNFLAKKAEAVTGGAQAATQATQAARGA